MKTIYIKKYKDEDSDTEYITPFDIFKYYDEFSDRGQYYYNFLLKVADYLHYFNHNTSTAFGNPDYARMDGIILGWCYGAGWQLVEDIETIKILSQKGRTIMIIEKPKKSLAEIKKREELKEMWEKLLG